MTELSASFAPDWVLPPGESILELAEERDWTQAELAKRLGYSAKHVNQLIKGKVPISNDTAARLERVLGGSIDFWLALELNFQKHKARLEALEDYTNWVSWLNELPVKYLMSFQAIEKLTLTSTNKPRIVESCLRFFQVASPDEWRRMYSDIQVSFRRGQEVTSDVGAISAWLRLGEIKAKNIKVPNYSPTRFQAALDEIRNLTRLPQSEFEPKMRSLLAEAGVTFIIIPSIPRARVSGVARWITPSRPLIQLSLYGKTNDKFWFTFFHEAAHILLHAKNSAEKKSIFLDDPNAARSTDQLEHEANMWAANHLIPQALTNELPGLRSKDAVRVFAKKTGLHPAIVVGRLQHEKLIPASWFNDLKESFSLA